MKSYKSIISTAGLLLVLMIILCGCGITGINSDFTDKEMSIGKGSASANVRNLNIEWVAGDITILYDDVQEIRFEESAKEELEEDARMRYTEKDAELTISFCKEKSVNNVPPKKLTIVLPKEYEPEQVKLDVVSSDINLPDGFAAGSLHVNCVSGNIISSGEVVIENIEIGGVSGEAELSVKGLKHFKAEMVSGDVQLTLPKDTEFTATVDSVSGKVSTDFETRTDGKTLTRGSGSGAEIKMSSISGDLKILAGE